MYIQYRLFNLKCRNRGFAFDSSAFADYTKFYNRLEGGALSLNAKLISVSERFYS